MPYANEGQISTSPIAGGVSITTQQYQQALAGMSEGKLVTIAGGFAVIDPPEPEPEPEPTLEERRGAAFLERVPFLLGLLGMGKITDSIADEASDGSWPSAWDSDIASLPLADRMAVKALWKKADTVEYYGPFTTTLAVLAQTESAPVTITQAEQDTLFGIEP